MLIHHTCLGINYRTNSLKSCSQVVNQTSPFCFYKTSIGSFLPQTLNSKWAGINFNLKSANNHKMLRTNYSLGHLIKH